MSVERRVREHFDEDALRFDSIYLDDKGPLTRFIDNVWRGVVRRRLELSLELLRPLQGKSVLDVGCGSGRYCVALARAGASSLLGIDFSQAMIDLARKHAQEGGVAARCDFWVGTFPDVLPEEKFDASLAIGFFDYVSDPVPTIQAMHGLTRSVLLLSFPKSREWRVPIRRLRFRLSGCPLFLYSEARVRALLAQTTIAEYEIMDLGRDYFVVARP